MAGGVAGGGRGRWADGSGLCLSTRSPFTSVTLESLQEKQFLFLSRKITLQRLPEKQLLFLGAKNTPEVFKKNNSSSCMKTFHSLMPFRKQSFFLRGNFYSSIPFGKHIPSTCGQKNMLIFLIPLRKHSSIWREKNIKTLLFTSFLQNVT